MIDFVVVLVVFRKWKMQPRVLVRGDYFDHPLLGPILRSLNAIPAGRSHGKVAMAEARDSLARGEVIVLTPEGHIPKERGPDGLAELRPGVGVLAAEFGAHVLLMGGSGTEFIWNVEHRMPRFSFVGRKRPTIKLCVEWLPVSKGADVHSVMEEVRTGLSKLVEAAQQSESN